MKIILIEGPDKCGKTTFIKKMAKQGHLTAALPSREFKAKLMAEPEKYNNPKTKPGILNSGGKKIIPILL